MESIHNDHNTVFQLNFVGIWPAWEGGTNPPNLSPPPTPIRVLVIELHVRDSYGVTSYSLLAGVISHG